MQARPLVITVKNVRRKVAAESVAALYTHNTRQREALPPHGNAFFSSLFFFLIPAAADSDPPGTVHVAMVQLHPHELRRREAVSPHQPRRDVGLPVDEAPPRQHCRPRRPRERSAPRRCLERGAAALCQLLSSHLRSPRGAAAPAAVGVPGRRRVQGC